MDRKKKIYLIILIVVLFLSTFSGTYAYLSNTLQSHDNSVETMSSNYSLSLNITPKYTGFKTIPMDDENVIKAINKDCKDKYNRGACSAYLINLDGYDANQGLLTGTINVTLNNITNLSFMLFEQKEENNNENECVTIDENIYCISKPATKIENEKDLPLGSFDLSNSTEKKFLLVIWLTNLEMNQNTIDLGSYNATVSFSMGSGKITGNIAAAIGNEDILQSQSGG